MSVRDWLILKDVERAVGDTPGIQTTMVTVCDSNVEVPATGFPAGLVLWKETREKLSGTESGEVVGRVAFEVAILTRETDSKKGLEMALELAEAARTALLADTSRGGLASATAEGAATEVGTAQAVKDRKSPMSEVRLAGSCGYYVSR